MPEYEKTKHLFRDDDSDSAPERSAPGCDHMEIVGIWVIKEAITFDENANRVWRSKEDVLADDSLDEDFKEAFLTKFAFEDDGFMHTIMPIPAEITQEEIDQALAEGEIELYGDGFMSVEKHPWKIEDGKLMVDTGIKGEVFGEKISPWAEAPIKDGIMEYVTYRLVKERF